MSVATNLVGRPVSWFDKTKKQDDPTAVIVGVVCAVYEQVDPRIAPRIAFETQTGQIKSAPLEEVWLLELQNGDLSGLGEEMLKKQTSPENTDGGTGKADR